MPTRYVCEWCNRILTAAPQPDPSLRRQIFCSLECLCWEQYFAAHYSNEQIGLRYFEVNGINPNDRGKRYEEARKGSPKTPPRKA